MLYEFVSHKNRIFYTRTPRFIGKYVTGRRERFRPYKVYKCLIRILSYHVRMNGSRKL